MPNPSFNPIFRNIYQQRIVEEQKLNTRKCRRDRHSQPRWLLLFTFKRISRRNHFPSYQFCMSNTNNQVPIKAIWVTRNTRNTNKRFNLRPPCPLRYTEVKPTQNQRRLNAKQKLHYLCLHSHQFSVYYVWFLLSFISTPPLRTRSVRKNRSRQ